MMTPPKEFPPLDQLMTQPIEEVGLSLLRYLRDTGSIYFCLSNVVSEKWLDEYIDGASCYKRPKVEHVIAEAWCWIERRGYIATSPGDQGSRFITRKGMLTLDREAGPFKSQLEEIASQMVLDPVLSDKVRLLYLRGDYETAVFAAFKELEIMVREVVGQSEEKTGVPLMRAAFGKGGMLHDDTLPQGESDSIQHLFAGAIGLFRNSTAHRRIDASPEEAIELIYFANFLLRLVRQTSERKLGYQTLPLTGFLSD